MASLYTHKEANIRKTWLYLILFGVLVIALGWVISYVVGSYAVLVIAVVLSIAMSAGSYWWSHKLVLSMTNAQPADKEEYRELHRLVENLCITAGLPQPDLYVIEEAQPNAFATGRDPDHAVIAVTTGLLKKLERSELEGVLAHELAHIGNRDMLISTATVVLAGIIVLLADFFFRIALFGGLGGGGDRGGGQVRALLLAGAIIGAVLAPIGAQMIKFAVSRKREFLADSSGALLTRYPDGLANALEKIAGDDTSMKRANDATAHLYIANPFRGKEAKRWLHRLFTTHPPVEERVQALRDMDM